MVSMSFNKVNKSTRRFDNASRPALGDTVSRGCFGSTVALANEARHFLQGMPSIGFSEVGGPC